MDAGNVPVSCNCHAVGPLTDISSEKSSMKNHQSARNNYDRLSRWYDTLSGFGEKRIKLYGLQKLNIQPGEQVLDLGCGTGDMLVLMGSSVGRAGRVYGLDLSSKMLEVAKAKVRKCGVSERVDIIQGDALTPPLADDKLDAVFMSFTLELFDASEMKEVLRAIRNILHQTGRLGIIYLSESSRPGLLEKLYVWMHTRWPHFIDCRPIQLLRTLDEEGFRVTNAGVLSMWRLMVGIVVVNSC